MSSTVPVKGKNGAATEPAQPSLLEELEAIPYEPLLPVEKKLIAWSIGTGIVLLVLLAVISSVFFRA